MRLLISLAFGSNWVMYHWDISVAFTNAKAEEETYVRFSKSFPEGLFPGYKGGTIARLKRNLHGSKSAPKLWYKCLYEVLIELGFKSQGIIMITYIKTSKNIADIMTKQSAEPQFVQHRDYALGSIDAITAVIAALAYVWRRLRFRV